jgi:ribosomal protein S25
MSYDYDLDSSADKVSVITKTRRMDKKYGKVIHLDTKKRDSFIPPTLLEKLREDIPKMKVITANDLAIRNDIRVSTIKKFLMDLANEGLIDIVSSSSRLKVFTGNKKKIKE